MEAETAASVRETARAQLATHAKLTCADSIRAQLIDGHFNLQSLRRSLGSAVVKPEWALVHEQRVHEQRRLIGEQGDMQRLSSRHENAAAPQIIGTRQVAGCAGCAEREEKERSWALFVETRLRPTLEAIEARAARRQIR